ncbi:MAG: AraC family transcriptional regulator [Bacteroidales bacterium]|nr:AraC family transcriptional regulator [Bacteroidales bacterium]
MKIYGTEPERALAIIDSALIAGNVNSFQADYFRARIYANSIEDPRMGEAVAMCERLLQHDSTVVSTRSGTINRRKVLEVMMDACRKLHDDDKWLRCADELAGLCHSLGMETEALRMEAEIGAVFTSLGRTEEGLAKLGEAIRALDEGAPSLDRIDAGIVARKRRIVALDKLGRYAEMIPDCLAIIQKLEDYRSRPGEYAEDSFRLRPEPAAHERYCNFYLAQARAYMAIACTCITPPDLQTAERYARLAEQSEFGRSWKGRWTLSTVWKALGEWDKVIAISNEVADRIGTDTVSTDFAITLKDRADAALAKGQYRLAASYLQRQSGIKDKLNEKRNEASAQEYAARYHSLEQEKILQEEKARSTRKDSIIAIISVIMLIVVVFAVFSVRQRRSIIEKNRALVRIIGELNKSREVPANEEPKPDREMFDLIDGTIRNEKLYTDVKLQRQDIVDRFNISRHSMNDLFSAYADGLSFTAYINNLRLQDAIRLLQEEPELSISEIAAAVGFTPANFREQFKRQYGMTPTEYRQNT